VYIWLLSRIGQPIDQPAVAAAQVVAEEPSLIDEVRSKIAAVIEYELENIDKFCMELAEGKISVC
jgi:S-adenosylmethionine synthetase